jgi:GTPase involved in cell partitioning and DNA repair
MVVYIGLIYQIFFKKTVKIEIRDFPGENSELFCNDFESNFHQTQFFKWVMQASSLIFIIDIANVLLYKEKYNEQMIKSIMTAWQQIFGYHIGSEKKIRNKRVCIVFTKSDLLLQAKNYTANNEIHSLGFKKYPNTISINNKKELCTEGVEKDFSELKNILRNKK